MILLENSIIDIIKRYDMLFLSMTNVIGVGLGSKIIKGIDTKEPCIHILVTDKVHSSKLYKKDIIPKTFLVINTDVVKSGVVAPHGLDILNDSEENLNDIKILKSYMRPIQAGFSIDAVGKAYSGTIGAIVFDNEEYESIRNRPFNNSAR